MIDGNTIKLLNDYGYFLENDSYDCIKIFKEDGSLFVEIVAREQRFFIMTQSDWNTIRLVEKIFPTKEGLDLIGRRGEDFEIPVIVSIST